jgi:hypothetical protein
MREPLFFGGSSMTLATVPKGTVQRKTWSYTDENMMGGKKVKSRVTKIQ